MAPTGIISGDDFQEILSDALTSFSPLATLVGAESARAFAHEVTNKKQTVFATLAPIGALGMMATVCKGSDLPGVKDLLGAGDTDLLDAAADVGCYVLFGLVPRMSKRGGMHCKDRQVNRGIATCAILTLEWNLGDKAIDFEDHRTFLRDFNAATVSGRVEWACDDSADMVSKLKDVRDRIFSSLGEGYSLFEADKHMALYEALENVHGGRGYVELHWPSPSMPLETRPYILYVFITSFLLVFFIITIFSASPLLEWQSPQASALLLGGQLVLGIGQTMTHVIIKRLRLSKKMTIPAKGVVPQWQLVDNTWFTSMLARRSLAPSTSGGRVHLGQHYNFSRTYLPRWQALLNLALLVIGFVAFYIGAKSSDVKTVVIFIGLYVLAHGSKGYIVHLANACYLTPLNNFGWQAVVNVPDDGASRRSWWRFWGKAKSTDETKSAEDVREDADGNRTNGEAKDQPEIVIDNMLELTPVLERMNDNVRTVEEEVSRPASLLSRHQPIWDMPKDAINPMLIPLPASRDTTPIHSTTASLVSSMRSRQSSRLVRPRNLSIPRDPSRTSLHSPPSDRVYGATLRVNNPSRTRLSAIASSRSVSSKSSVVTSLPVVADEDAIDKEVYPDRIPLPISRPASLIVPSDTKSVASPVLPQPVLPLSYEVEYRLYAKVAVRNVEAIGMFYFSREMEWAMAAHIIYNVVHRYLGDMGWQHPEAKEPTCEVDFQFERVFEDRPPKLVRAILLVLVDAVRFEDLFWYTGQEICAILMDCFSDAAHIPSEHHRSTDTRVICEWVYIMTRFLLMSQGMYGSKSLMRSIDLVKTKRPYDDSVIMNPYLWDASERAAADLRISFNPEFIQLPPGTIAGDHAIGIMTNNDDATVSQVSAGSDDVHSHSPMTPSVIVSQEFAR